MVAFRGSTQEKSPFSIFRFGDEIGASDKKVPDPVGSAVFVLQEFFVRQLRSIGGSFFPSAF